MTKLISVRDEVYSLLLNYKRASESFSDLFLRLTRKPGKKSVSELAGAWKDLGEMDAIFGKMLVRRSARARVRL